MAAAATTKVVLVVFLLQVPLALCSPMGPMFQQQKAHYHSSPGADPGDPLYLTPYIKKGDFATGTRYIV